MVTVLGGTFSCLHKGHKKLLDFAVAQKRKVIIGLTTDEFAAPRKRYAVPDFESRKSALRKYLEGIGADFEIRPLSSRNGDTHSDPNYSTLVVSEETLPAASLINLARQENGIKPLKIVTCPTVRGDDLIAIRSSRIFDGRIDGDGRRKFPVSISVSTSNKLKLDTVKSFLSGLFGNISVQLNSNYKTDTEQPFGDDISEMACRRAESDTKGAEYSIGIESGIVLDHFSGKHIDFHCCCVIDLLGERSIGFSSGFPLPEELITEIKQGFDMTEAFYRLHGVSNIGEKEGIAGYYSNGLVTREQLIRESIRNAFSLRMQPGEEKGK